MSDSRLGAPVELPWWTVPLAVPPILLALAGIVVAAPVWAHLMAVAASAATLIALVRIATRVRSPSMQSVWISAVYAVWFFVALTWLVVAITTPTCHCS